MQSDLHEHGKSTIVFRKISSWQPCKACWVSTEPSLTETAKQMHAQCPVKDVTEKIVYIQGGLIRRSKQRQEEWWGVATD